MNLNHDFELAELANYTFGQTHLGFIHFTPSGDERLSDIAGAHGTEQLTLFTRRGGNFDGTQRSQRLASSLCRGQRLRGCRFQLSASCLELGNIISSPERLYPAGSGNFGRNQA